MKLITKVFLAVAVVSGSASGMTRLDDTGGENTRAVSTAPQQQSGRLGAVHAGTGKLVIDGVTYAYNPLTTVVTINGKRSTISALKSGDVVRFQSVPQGAGWPALLSSIGAQKQ